MSRTEPQSRADQPESAQELGRLNRPLSLQAQVESVLRAAVAARRFPDDRLPTEVELAEQLGVSRETVRRAAGVLMREGLLVKYRRKGTFLAPLSMALAVPDAPTCLGYLQASYGTGATNEAAVCRTIDGLILQGAVDEAGRHGMTVLVEHLHSSGGRDVVRHLDRGGRPAGLIFASCGDDKLIRGALGRGVPLVLVDHDLDSSGVSTVRDDSYEGARLAVGHLARSGHRRIAIAYWRQAELNPWRMRGYRQGLRDAGLPRRQRWELLAELNEAGARDAVRQFLALAPRPTALYCFNNALARLVIDEFARQGVRVPEDVSVMGAGGEEVPGLSCTAIDWHAMGRAAVEVLRRHLADNNGPPEHRLFPHTLNAGRTAAPLK